MASARADRTVMLIAVDIERRKYLLYTPPGQIFWRKTRNGQGLDKAGIPAGRRGGKVPLVFYAFVWRVSQITVPRSVLTGEVDLMTTTTTTMELRLAPATVEDARVIVSALRGLADDLGMAADCAASEESVREALRGPHPSIEALIAWYETDWAGVAVFFQTHSSMLARPTLFLDDLYVRPECRSRGTGRNLLQGVAQLAFGRGCSKVEWLVPKWNARAIEFYERQGAILLDERYRCRLNEEAMRLLVAGAWS